MKNLISYKKKEQREWCDEIVIAARSKKIKRCIMKQELRYIFLSFFFNPRFVRNKIMKKEKYLG